MNIYDDNTEFPALLKLTLLYRVIESLTFSVQMCNNINWKEDRTAMGTYVFALLIFSFISCRVNGKLVALKVIRLQEEEGTPFTAIREGGQFYWLPLFSCLSYAPSCLIIIHL